MSAVSGESAEWEMGLDEWVGSEESAEWEGVEWQLPGQGESGPRCGNWEPVGVCDTCAEPEFRRHRCGNRSCPVCWGTWAKNAAVRASVRIQAFRYTQPDNWRRQVAHGIVSPPEGEVRGVEEFYRGKKRAAEIAEAKGWRGFAVIGHPYRPTAEAKEKYRSVDPDYGMWVWLRNDVEDMQRHVYWSPHYHIIGATSADLEPAKDSDEWVYVFERSLARFDGVRDRESHGDLYGLYRYLLSHTGFPAGSRRQAVTWYGCLANNVFVHEASAEWQHEKPSAGVLAALEREVEAVAGGDDEEDEDDDEGRECPVEGCDGEVIGVFDRWPGVSDEVRTKLQIMADWVTGVRHPPPGMRHPQTEEQAHEAFEQLLSGDDRRGRY